MHTSARVQRKEILLLLFVPIVFTLALSAQSTGSPPAWAYPAASPDYKPPVDNGELRHVPGSSAAWTLTQVSDRFFAPDWHPEEHPPLPLVVARGRKPDVFACGFCHRAEGTGGPENANLTGLSPAYIVQQMADFKSGARKSSLPNRIPSKLMTDVAKSATAAEIAEAAAYFSRIKPRKLITVVEAEDVPKNYVAGWVYSPLAEKEKEEGKVNGVEGTEPLAGRILEMPKNLEQFESRDTHSEFIAYVPPGSIAVGKKLATTTSAGKAFPCVQCHGQDLRGLADVPGIAGRSPSYLFRQLYDLKHGARKGPNANLMKPVLANLSEADLTALCAYAASLNP